MKLKSIGMLAALALSSAAMAQTYIGATIGSSHLSDDCSGTVSCSTNATGFKLTGGYKINPNIGVEFNYINFGSAKATISTGAGPASVTDKNQMFGVGLAVHGALASNLNGVARLGFGSVAVDMNVSVAGQSVSDSESNTNPYLGFGLGFPLTKELSLTAGVDYTRAKFGGSSTTLRLISIGAMYSF